MPDERVKPPDIVSPVLLTSSELWPVTAPVTFPTNAAVTVPAVKLPEASRATIAEAVLALVAVVALLDTFEAVEIVPK